MLATKIAITAPLHPKYLYSTREDAQQLLRRIDEIIDMDEPTNDTTNLQIEIHKDLNDNHIYNDDD